MRHRLHICKFGICLLCGLVFGSAFNQVQAQDNSKPTSPRTTPPALPMPKPPIEYFRELLAMPLVDRERSIADRSETQKKMIQAKLKEYESMSPEERELRLAVTELRWHLVPLMRIAPEQRVERLKMIPETQRSLVEDRLRRWDRLSAEQQKEFLESEMTVNYFLRLQASTPEQQTNLIQTFSNEHRQKLEKELARWKALPSEDRDRMSDRFEEFFELKSSEKEKMLSTLSQAERAQMEKTLATFQNLSPEQRRHCIESFDKLASMNGRERLQFLRKAEAWEKMSPTDRTAWRELVSKLPQMPPLPPGMKLGSPLPPVPLIATNSPR